MPRNRSIKGRGQKRSTNVFYLRCEEGMYLKDAGIQGIYEQKEIGGPEKGRRVVFRT